MKVASKHKEFNGLNLTATQVDKFIAISEREVAEEASTLQRKLIPLKEAEQLHLEARAEYDAAESKLAESKLLLNELIRFKKDEDWDEQGRLLRATSHLSAPNPQHIKEFTWLPYAIDVLKEIQRFITPEDLYSIILQKHPDISKTINKRNAYNIYKQRVSASLLKACDGKQSRKRSKQLIIEIKGRIGLIEWASADMIPLAQYVKDFMYGKVG